MTANGTGTKPRLGGTLADKWTNADNNFGEWLKDHKMEEAKKKASGGAAAKRKKK